MANTEELGLKIWLEAEDPEFEIWRKELNGNQESDMVKIDRFAKKTNQEISIIKEKIGSSGSLADKTYVDTQDEAIKTEVNNKIGSLETLTTAGKENVVGAVNEVHAKANTNTSKLEEHTESLTNIEQNLTSLKNELVKATVEQAIEGIVDVGYMTPYLVAEAIKWGVATDGGVELKHIIKSTYINKENQKEVEIPFENFDETIHFLEVRVGGVPFFHERYTVEEGKIVLATNEVGFSIGKRIDFVITYLEQVAHNRLPVNGKNLLDGSITENKLSQDLQNKIKGLSTTINELELKIKTLESR